MIDVNGVLKIGEKTKWGHVGAIALIARERYYFIVSKKGIVSMMPATAAETARTAGTGKK